MKGEERGLSNIFYSSFPHFVWECIRDYKLKLRDCENIINFYFSTENTKI